MNTTNERFSPLHDGAAGSCQSLHGTDVGKAASVTLTVERSLNLQRPDMQNATSTTSHEAENGLPISVSSVKVPCMPTDPATVDRWTVDDVMRYLTSVDSGLSIHTQLFQKHVTSSIKSVSRCES